MKAKRPKGTGHLTIVKRGGKTYYYAKFGTKTTPLRVASKREAMIALNRIALERQSAEEGEQEEPKKIFLKDLSYEYSKRRRGEVKDSTLAAYAYEIDRFVTWFLKKYGVHSIVAQVTQDKVEAYLVDEDGFLGKSATYKKNFLCYLKSVFEVLGVEPNPFTKVKLKGGYKYEHHMAFTDEEVERILATAQGDIRNFCLLSLETGLRRIDCCNLRWSNIDFEKNRINMTPRKTEKHGISVSVPMSKPLREMLESLPRDSVYVLPGIRERNIRSSSNISCIIKRLFEKCGIETMKKVDGCERPRTVYSFHSFRSTFITRCINKGIPAEVVADMAGHSVLAQTLEYRHQMDDTIDNYASKMNVEVLPSREIQHKWKELRSLLPECEEREKIGRLVEKIVGKM